MSNLLFIISFIFLHPLHLSITNIDVDNDTGEVKITSKLYKDDLENALGRDHQIYPLNVIETEQKNRLEEYFNERFYVLINSEKIIWDSLYIHPDNEYLIFELKEKIKNPVSELKIYNALLLNAYLDQVNLTILKYNNKEQGFKFNYKTKEVLWTEF